jgi:Kdo2-lipid IVA lauroyltransferase/acyltransferase
MRYVRGGGNAGLLMDQRMAGGVEVPFFGLPAYAPQTAALLAIKYNAVLLPVRVERLGGTRQRVTIYAPPVLPTDGTESERITKLTADIYVQFESWIRARPEQWLWMHDRWRLNKQ